MTTDLTAPVDVYAEWIDECELQNRKALAGHAAGAPAERVQYDEDDEEL